MPLLMMLQSFSRNIFLVQNVNIPLLILTIFPSENGLTFGKLPIIQRLLKGMFKERSTFPRYTVTYDVKPVFDFIKSLSCSDETSLEICTKALATLMCLLS